MNFLEYYNKNLKITSSKNVLEVQELAKKIIEGKKNQETQNLIKKIKNRIQRWGSHSSCLNILKKIIEDYDFAMEYAKPPTKQSVSELLQSSFLKSKGINLKKIKASGKTSMRFSNGEIVYGSQDKETDTKSFDFILDKNTYIYAKVTTTGFDNVDLSLTQGGGQKNQFNDALNFLKQANLYCQKNKDDKKFILLVDGDYYTKDKIKTLNEYKNKRVFITNSDEFKI
jgi:hypothetical protein